MIQRADTIGVFQIESRAQMSMLPRLRPEKFYDLVIEVAIVRPGPIQGGMVHPYLKRRQDKSWKADPDDPLDMVLEKTLGIPLFQEQAMQMAIKGAGFYAGEADQLRRAMAAWRRTGKISIFEEKFISGMLKTLAAIARNLPNAVLPDRRLCRIWLSRKPCGKFCSPGLCLLLAQMPLSRCLPLRSAQLAAHGLLCAQSTRPRCYRAWGRIA